MKNKKYDIYTDGAYAFDKKAGGWAYVILEDGVELFAHAGRETSTTNNRMELLAVINALEWCENLGLSGEINVFSDSSYVVNAFCDEWLEKWRNNGWKNSQKEPVVNKDLWEKLEELVLKTRTAFHHVKSRSCELNRKADKMSSQMARQ